MGRTCIFLFLLTTSTSLPIYDAFSAIHPALNWGFQPDLTFSEEAKKVTEEFWFEQILDHENIFDARVWQQRYFVRDDFYVDGGPIFLFLNGEWAGSGGFLTDRTQIGRMAAAAGALAVELEHRFYGLSQPFPTLDTENLAYLSIEQALADAANFAQKLSAARNLTGPWVVFGVSYSATLAAFARIRYPHIFAAAYSSSGPMLGKIHFNEYHEMTGEGLRLANPDCPVYLQAGMDELKALIATGDENNLNYVIDTFSVCRPVDLTNVLDVTTLYSVVANYFGALVQYAAPGSLESFCDNFMSGPGSPMENIAEQVKQAYQGMCITVEYATVMEFYRNITTPIPELIVRQFLYQSCTQFGWFFYLNSDNSPFGNIMSDDYFTNWCSEIYGPDFTEELLQAGVDQFNLNYGGLNPDVSHVVYLHGSYDGWRLLAADTDVGTDAPFLLIENYGHSADFGFEYEFDSESLKDARRRAAEAIFTWIGVN